MHRRIAVAGLFLSLNAGIANAQTSAAWLTGCWALRDGGRLVEENWTSAEAHMEAPPPSRIRIESAGRTLVVSIGTRPGWIGIEVFGT